MKAQKGILQATYYITGDSMSDQATRYREIEVRGTPRQLGQQIGEAARTEIQGFCEVALERVNKTIAISRDKAMAIATRCTELARAYSPDMVDELVGMSESSGVSLDQLMLLQVRNQFTAEPEAGCTSFSIAPSQTTSSAALIGQNWDNDPELDPFNVVLKRHPDGKPANMTITQAGLIAYIGLNDSGMGVCLNTLPAPSRQLGVPHYFTVRGIYESSSLEDAVQAVRRADRAVPANIMLGTPQGPFDLEVTIDDIHVLGVDDSVVTHTNHCLHPDLVAINQDFPELIESGPRKSRIDDRLQSSDQLDLASLQSALSDHDNYPRSICRHPNEDATTGFWTSVFSVILDTTNCTMHVTRGTPCNHPYEEYKL